MTTIYLPGGAWQYVDGGTLRPAYDGKGGFTGTSKGIPIVGSWTPATGDFTFVTEEPMPKTYDGSLVSPKQPDPEYGVYTLAGTIKDASGTLLGYWVAQQLVIP
jgi:hypothetical protein